MSLQSANGDTTSSVEDNTLDSGRARQQRSVHDHVYVPLNSLRLTVGQLRSLGTELGIPVSGTVTDLRLMIEGKITESSRDPRSVQVVLSRDATGTTFSLLDHEGVFLTVVPQGRVETSEVLPPEPMELDELQSLRQERDSLQEEVQTLSQKDKYLEKVKALKHEVESSKARAREIWRISCNQVEEFDATLTSKDQEIAQLKMQLAERERRVSPLLLPDDSTSDPMSLSLSRESRKGGAPPSGRFSGKNPEV